MAKILISTVPFGEKNRFPLELLKDKSIDYTINPLNKKFTEEELAKYIVDVDALIAGTEPITDYVLSKANKLKHISRVGIGLDSVDLAAAKNRNIEVSYTPDAPAPAVAELTLGLMLSLLRSVHISNLNMHNGKWDRIFGRRLSEIKLGIIGVGRIGLRVLRRTRAFGTPEILLNDIAPNHEIDREMKVKWTTKEDIFRNADLISLHLPLTHLTKNLISKRELLMMKKDALLINTSRGGIINENDLYNTMMDGYLNGVAIDVFEKEPYKGPLIEIDRCLLTSHMGSMSEDCRTRMEIEATEETVRYLSGLKLLNKVPLTEFKMQALK